MAKRTNDMPPQIYPGDIIKYSPLYNSELLVLGGIHKDPDNHYRGYKFMGKDVATGEVYEACWNQYHKPWVIKRTKLGKLIYG